jgi:hypothetical protein
LKRYDSGLKIEEDLKYYLSCSIKIDNQDGVAWIIQPNLINNLKAKFEEKAMGMQGHGTLGTPRFKIVRPNDED